MWVKVAKGGCARVRACDHVIMSVPRGRERADEGLLPSPLGPLTVSTGSVPLPVSLCSRGKYRRPCPLILRMTHHNGFMRGPFEPGQVIILT